MAASGKMVLVLKTPVMIPGYVGKSWVHSILCNPVVDSESPLSGVFTGGVNVGEDNVTGVRICIPKDNVAAYLYEQTVGAFDGLAVYATVADAGFVNLT